MLTAICAHSDNQARGKDALHLGLLIVHSSPQRPYGDPHLGNLDGGRNKNNRPQSLREIPPCLPYPTQSLTHALSVCQRSSRNIAVQEKIIPKKWLQRQNSVNGRRLAGNWTAPGPPLCKWACYVPSRPQATPAVFYFSRLAARGLKVFK